MRLMKKKLSKHNDVDRLVKENEYLANIITLLPGHIYWKDLNGHFLGCNMAQAERIGFSSPKDIIGKKTIDAISYELPENMRQIEADKIDAADKEVIRTGKAVTKEEPLILPNGQKQYFLSQKVPLKDKKDKVVGILGVSVDITQQKLVEKQLKEAKKEAEQSNKIKSEFISNMEHDIRTPFVGVYGMVKILADQENDPQKKSMLEDVELCAKELMDYCDSIVSFSRIESGTTPVISKSFKLKKLVDSVYNMEMIAAKAKEIDFSFSYDRHLPEIIIGDSSRLKRILINLISNAIKFTKTGYVKLSASLDHKESSSRKVVVKFAVEDTGVGIPKDKQVLIYERFTKLSKSNTGLHAGLGLGLNIVRQFVDELDGDIHLESVIGKGSTFSVYLAFKIPLSNNMNI